MIRTERGAAGAIEIYNGLAPGDATWTTATAPGCDAALEPVPGHGSSSLRFDFELRGHGAYAIARREISARLPAHYVAILRYRSPAGAAEFQIKLVDPSGANVWWWKIRPLEASPESRTIILRKAGLAFAWGPLGGGEPDGFAAVEMAVAVDSPTSGSIEIDELTILARPPSEDLNIRSITGSSQRPNHDAACALEPDDSTWRPVADDPAPSILCDFGATTEWGGLVLEFAGSGPAIRLSASENGERWRQVAAVEASSATSVWLRNDEDIDTRFARIDIAPGVDVSVRRVSACPLEFALAPERYLARVAERTERGLYPRHLLGEQRTWALVAAEGDERKALLGEDGALELSAESCTIEPFLWMDGRLHTWADVTTELALADGSLPIPSVRWQARNVTLSITAFMHGESSNSTLAVRYSLATDAEERHVRLFLAVRPFQVTPAWQNLNLSAAFAPIHRIEAGTRAVRVDGDTIIVATAPAAAVGASGGGNMASFLVRGDQPPATEVEDPLGLAEAVLAYDVQVRRGQPGGVDLVIPMYAGLDHPQENTSEADARAWVEQSERATRAAWRQRLANIPIELPPAAREFSDTLRASLAWILCNRVGPKIQPGPRCYRRSWIRDGAITGAALAEMGFGEVLRDFVTWYAPYQLPDGRVPCAVDSRGIDLVAEHDSHGQLLFGIAEMFRLLRDETSLRALWPHVVRAVAAIETLLAERSVADREGDPSYGLLPESISHEGYSSRPVHSYWDDLFALKGVADTADVAAEIGEMETSRRCEGIREALRRDIARSMLSTMATHGLDVIPGSVELGDFDPASTAAAFDPCEAWPWLPEPALRRTFERYWEEVGARRDGRSEAQAYTPYEVRNASALVLLGERERAHELLAWFISDQRPVAWRQWPEIAWCDTSAPRFIGDSPHGWVASSFIRALRRMLVYERPDTDVLVLGAGIPAAWLDESAPIRLTGLPTRYGPLTASIEKREGAGVRVRVESLERLPRGGIEIDLPDRQRLRRITVDGVPRPVGAAGSVLVQSLPCEVLLEYERSEGS